uniref:CCT domain-containing protein n=1 Tax=Leersia perrieri TaxID=77586 RepID=A0A0D9XN17_9ORYZ
MYHQSWSTSCSSSSEAAAAAATRVAAVGSRYSAEERRERIDKYRTKRNQRNFDKKITYACRKTLADSRPRVKGRFARNSDDGGPAASAPADESSFEVSPHAPLTTSTANVVPEWWPAVQEALATQEQDDAAADELLAAYLGVSSLDLYSPPRH